MIEYLSRYDILFSVTVPLIFTIYWYLGEGRTSPPNQEIIWHWMLCVIGSYVLSFWTVTEDTRELHIINGFFIYLAFRLYAKLKMSPSTAFSLSFLCIFVVDIVRALELAVQTDQALSTFYAGIGGAGMSDGLLFFPIASAALVHYVEWRTRKRDRTVPFITSLSRP